MPNAPRESSVTNRRPTQRVHRPFPMDMLTQGRRTGLTAQYVERDSDGVEDFEGVLAQLDNKNVKPTNVPRRKKSVVHIPLFDQDEDDYQMEDDTSA
jgi:hypothetical protein